MIIGTSLFVPEKGRLDSLDDVRGGSKERST